MKYFLPLFCLLFSITLNSITEWGDMGVPVHQSSDAILEENSVICEDGGVVTFWTDTRNGFRSLFAQKIDINGNKLWEEDGVLIFQSEGFVYGLQVVASIDNSVVIAFLKSDNRYLSTSSMVLQKINSDGNIHWGVDGKQIFSQGNYIINPKLFAHSNGDITAFWFDEYSDKIRAVKTNSDGIVVNGWGYDFSQANFVGIDVIDNFHNKYSVTSDHQDGFMIASIIETDIYMQHLDTNGNKLLGTLGTLIVDLPSYIQEIEIGSSIQDEYYIAWYINSEDNIYLQKINQITNTLWENPIIITESQSHFNLMVTADSQPIIEWREYNYETFNLDYFIQKFSTTGIPLWDENNSYLGDSYLFNIKLSLSDDNGCILYAKKENETNELLVILQKIDENGIKQFDDCGIIIGTTSYESSNNLALSTDNNNIFVSWDVSEDENSIINIQALNFQGDLLFSEEDKLIFSDLKGSALYHKTINAAGLPLISWADTREDSKIYVQMLNENGEPIFQENGIAISNYVDLSENNFDVAFSENSQIISVAWEDENINDNYIYAQALDLQGNLLWGENGLTLFDNSAYLCDNVVISSLNEDGHDSFIVAWEEFGNNFENITIRVQKIVDGEILWDDNGVAPLENQGQNKVIDVIDNYIIYTHDPAYFNQDLYIQKLDGNGNVYPGWPQEGLQLDNSISHLNQIQYEHIPQGLLVSWLNSSNDIIEMQIVSENADLFWEDPLSFEFQYLRFFKTTFNEYIYLTSLEDNYDEDFFRISKISLDGENIWSEVNIIANQDVRNFNQVAVGNNIAIAWQMYDENLGNFIKIQEITPNGELIYSNEGINIFGQYGYSQEPQIFFNGEHAYVTCEDIKSMKLGYEGPYETYNIYAQKLSLETLEVLDDEIELNTLSNFPNPFNPSTTINYSLPEGADKAKIEIYNTKGQYVSELKIENKKNNTVTWNGIDSNDKPVSSGVYFYKLNVDGKNIATNKMLLIK